MATFDFHGASGKRYTFSRTPITEAFNLPHQKGIIILATDTHLAPSPVYIVAVQSLREGLRYLTEAKEKYGANLLYFRVGWGQESQEQGARDLIAAYDPPLNAITA